ncbi:MAG: glyoxalase/bleomycin resistance/dioxygenase family protein [Actinomycetia bacterium]|nr:glyoxalase/bleomycin resistance/dioxygenase family protein [Actinomycetes bacterium]
MDQVSGLQAVRTLDYTVLLCENIERMREFYAEVLGLVVRREVRGRYVEFEAGAVVLALRLRSRSYDGPANGRARASVHLGFRVPPGEVAVAEEQLAARGIELLEPVQDLADFGHRVLFFGDPENNVVEIYAEI